MNNHQVIDQQAQAHPVKEVVFTNANLLIGNEVVMGSLKVENGVITDIDTSSVSVSGIDCEGDYLSPGLIELHTDNLERHLQPPPGAHPPTGSLPRSREHRSGAPAWPSPDLRKAEQRRRQRQSDDRPHRSAQ